MVQKSPTHEGNGKVELNATKENPNLPCSLIFYTVLQIFREFIVSDGQNVRRNFRNH